MIYLFQPSTNHIRVLFTKRNFADRYTIPSKIIRNFRSQSNGLVCPTSFCACAEEPFNFVCTCAVSSTDCYRFLLYLSGPGVSTDEFIVRHRFINNLLSINVKVSQHAGLECNDPHLRWRKTFSKSWLLHVQRNYTPC